MCVCVSPSVSVCIASCDVALSPVLPTWEKGPGTHRLRLQRTLYIPSKIPVRHHFRSYSHLANGKHKANTKTSRVKRSRGKLLYVDKVTGNWAHAHRCVPGPFSHVEWGLGTRLVVMWTCICILWLKRGRYLIFHMHTNAH